MRVVLDTNVIISSLSTHSPYHLIIQALINCDYNLVISSNIAFEYQEKISAKYDRNTSRYFAELLHYSSNVISCEPSFRWNLITSDPDDNKFVDCAIAGQADYIVTEDRDFKVLRNIEFPSMAVISISEFMQMLEETRKI